jgi:hypothetical protein
MGFAVWIDRRNSLAWAQGTHEYRPMGTAVISLEEVNASLRAGPPLKLRWTPGHLRGSR